MPKGTASLARLIESLDRNAIAARQHNYNTYGPLDPNDIALLAGFVTATAELVKILKRRSPKVQNRQGSSTPVQPTFPQDPDYSGGSTESKDSNRSNDSAGSTDSKAEHFTHQYAYQFLLATVNAFGLIHESKHDVPWIHPDLSMFITTYDLFVSMQLTSVQKILCGPDLG
jgi:hypothetical protein